MDTVHFARMADGSREDYLLLDRYEKAHIAATADRVLAQLELLRGSMGGYKVDRLEHSLQTATRAFRDGADEETVVCALLHDIGDVLAPENHSALAAAVVQPYVSEANHWVVLHHGLFQGYYYWHHLGGDRNARDRFRGHPHFARCVAFCEDWDQAAFDPAYDTMPLDAFAPMVQRIFARPAFAMVEGERPPA
jgi:predicted HD phosphohydrolase